MPEDLPIYSDSMLRTRLQFADLERFKGMNVSAVWDKSDAFIEKLEGGDKLCAEDDERRKGKEISTVE